MKGGQGSELIMTRTLYIKQSCPRTIKVVEKQEMKTLKLLAFLVTCYIETVTCGSGVGRKMFLHNNDLILILLADHHNRLHVKQKYRANAESRNDFKKVLEKGKGGTMLHGKLLMP